MEEQYKGVHGFRNGAPAYASNSWANVDLFLHTWGFLPGDTSILEKLSKEQLIELCNIVMECACRIDLDGEHLKTVQEYMHELGISPESLKENNLL